MAVTLNGTTGFLEFAAAFVTSYPMSMSMWVSQDGNQDQYWISQGQSNADRNIAAWVLANGVDKLATIRNPGNGNNADKNTAPNPSTTLKLAVVTFASASSQKVYFGDNTAVASSAAMVNDIANHDHSVIGAHHYNSGSPSNFTKGAVAEATWYNVELATTEIDLLLAGAKPETVTGCVKCFPLRDTSDLTSTDGLSTLTLVGGVSNKGSHPISRSVPDTTAPVLSSPTGAPTGNTTASASVSTDEGAGTIWCLTNTAATATASAVKAGTSQAVTATGVQTFASRTGMTADTLYYNHFVQDDAAGTPNTSAVVNSASFRTTGAVTFSGPVPTRNGVVGTAASFANASFFASAFTLTYTLQAGTLPAGLTLGASTGIISGTPTTAGTSSGIVIRATDTNSNTADTNAYSIVIAATNASPTFPGTISNISGTAGSAITPVNVSGQFSDTDALAYTASPAGTAWPSALVVNSSTGIISGTVAGAGTTTSLKVRATDTASQSVDSNAFNAVIAAAPANPTVTLPVALCHAMGGLPLISEPGKVQFLSKTDLTAAPLANVSKTTNADGTLTPWTQAGLTAGVLVTLRWISDADGHEGYYDVTPA